MRGLLSCVAVVVVVLCLGVVSSVSGQTDVTWYCQVDRVSARTARVQFLSSVDSGSGTSIQSTSIQWTNQSTQFSKYSDFLSFHNYIVAGPIVDDDHEYISPQVGVIPFTSYILRNLNPNQQYQVRIGYTPTSTSQNPTPTGTAPPSGFTTAPLSTITSLSALSATGGCGQLTTTFDSQNNLISTLYYLQQSIDNNNNTVYQCDVVAETTNVNITIVPTHAYASINTATTPALTATNQTLSITSTYADPLTQYTTTIPLNGTVTNFTWTVTSEAGTTQTYILSIRQPSPSTTAKIAGPTSPATAMMKSTSVPTPFQFLGLTWSSTSIKSWKAWSDDLVTYPYSSLSLVLAGSSATLNVVPAAVSVPDGQCSNVNVALFDQNGNSVLYTICISSIYDSCSSTPFGAATKWQSPFINSQTQTLSQSTNGSSLYYPAPPVPFFPVA